MQDNICLKTSALMSQGLEKGIRTLDSTMGDFSYVFKQNKDGLVEGVLGIYVDDLKGALKKGFA